MGQHLTVSLVSSFTTTATNSPEIVTRFCGGESAAYRSLEMGDTMRYELRSDLLQRELSDLLRAFYDDFYGSDDDETPAILARLRTCATTAEVLEVAERKSFYHFQAGLPQTAYFRAGWEEVTVRYQPIFLTLEGKIIMETYGEHFDYFTESMRLRYADFSLARALRVAIGE